MNTKTIVTILVLVAGLLVASSAQASVTWEIVGTAAGEPDLSGKVTTPDIPVSCDGPPAACPVTGTLTIPAGALGGPGTTIDLAVDPSNVFINLTASPPAPTDDFNFSGINKDGYACGAVEPFLVQCTHTSTATFLLALSQARVVIGSGNVWMTGQLEVAGQIIEPVTDTSCSVAECNAEGVTTLTCGDTQVEISCAVEPINYDIGESGPAGGWVFYVTADGLHGLEAAPEDQSEDALWGCNQTDINGAEGRALGTGARNTDDIVLGCSTVGIAARLAAEYESQSGYFDWYLPSKDELDLMYHRIGPGSIDNPNVGGFAVDFYWSSSEDGPHNAWYQYFVDGSQYPSNKNSTFMNKPFGARAIRTF